MKDRLTLLQESIRIAHSQKDVKKDYILSRRLAAKSFRSESVKEDLSDHYGILTVVEL